MSASHVKHSEKTPVKRRYKHRNADVPECSRCETRPPLPGQRYCRECKNAAARESYHRQKQELRDLRAMKDRQVGREQMARIRRSVERST